MVQNQSNNSGWLLQVQDAIKMIPALVFGVSSVCFILGLFVVNIHLAKYGIYSNDFLRTEYIVSGATFVLLIAISGICLRYIFKYKRDAESHWNEKRIWRGIVSFFGIFLAVWPLPILLMFINGNELVPIKALGISVFSVILVSGFILTAFKEIIEFIGERKSMQDNDIDLDELSTQLKYLVMPLFFLFSGITTYASMVYPEISIVYGGGNRALATLIPTTRGIEVCKSLALPIQNNQTIGPVEVLTESENELVILIQNGLTRHNVAIRLNKKLFDAIQTQSSYIYSR